MAYLFVAFILWFIANSYYNIKYEKSKELTKETLKESDEILLTIKQNLKKDLDEAQEKCKKSRIEHEKILKENNKEG